MHDATFTRRGFLAATGMAAITSGLPLGAPHAATAPPRIGFIGVGGRGTSLLKTMLKAGGVSIPAICDIDPDHLSRAQSIVEKLLGKRPEGYAKDAFDYRRMLEREDLDAVLIATPALLHAQMAVDGLRAGKHVGSEVPGAYTLEECRALVLAKEESGRQYMLLENYIYERSRMMIWNMVRQGLFGDPYYAECSYIHNCSKLRFESDGALTWRGQTKLDHFGNLYPTHSLGPVSKWLNINRGDRMTRLSSMMTRPRALKAYCERTFGAESPGVNLPWKAGDTCVTTISTAQEKLITVYYDTDSPRPLSIFYLVQGTQGVFDSRNGIYIAEKSEGDQWEKTEAYRDQYEHPYWREHGEAAGKTGHGGGDFFVISDFIEMARSGNAPLVDVYDSATWSAIMPLSEQSIMEQRQIEIPDFTNGAWKNRPAG